MAKITYHTHDNKTYTVDVQKGLTVMEGAIQNDIPGIDADCGGGMSCELAMYTLTMMNGSKNCLRKKWVKMIC